MPTSHEAVQDPLWLENATYMRMPPPGSRLDATYDHVEVSPEEIDDLSDNRLRAALIDESRQGRIRDGIVHIVMAHHDNTFSHIVKTGA